MIRRQTIWDLPDDPLGNVAHIAEHGITPDEVEQILDDAVDVSVSESTGRPIVSGHLDDGRFIYVIFEWVDEDSVYPVTAYEPDED